MTLVNRARGEVRLTIGEADWRLRPSFERLVAAEAELGSLFQLLDRSAAGDVRIGDAEALFWCCLDGDRPERERFRSMLMDAGLMAVMGPYRQLLAQIFGAR